MKRCVLLLLLALPLLAQQDPTDELWTPAATDPRSITSYRQRFKDRSKTEAYINAFTAMEAEIRTSSAYGLQPSQKRTREALQDQIAIVLRQLGEARELTTIEGATEFLVKGYTTERFRRDQRTEVNPATNVEREVVFWFRITGEQGNIVVTLDDLKLLPTAGAEDFRYRVDTAHALLKEFISSAYAQTQKDIGIINGRWELFLNKGPSQYPWESFLNGLLVETDFVMPPTRQYIIVHPMPVVELTGPISELRGNNAFAVELLGYAHYKFTLTDDKPALRWWGVSATAGIHEGHDPSFGVMGHYNRTVTAGVLWLRDDPDRDISIILGLDLYQLVKKKVPEYRERLQRLKERTP
jgi:hypothetical protein